MTSIEIKTENPESEDIKPEINEGGGVGGVASNAATAAFVGVKTIVVEKTQAALKVANEAKQLNLRLREQKQLQQQPPTTTVTIRRNSFLNREENTDASKSPRMPPQIGAKRFRAIAPKPSTTAATPSQPTNKPISQPYYKPTAAISNKPRLLAKSAFAGRSSSSSKCGEIFVTNNANKWTFICTFCQKTTRDIGAFVCHIKFKHMGGQYNDDDHDDDDDDNGGDDDDDNNGDDDTYNNTHDQDVRSLTNYNYNNVDRLKSENLLSTKTNHINHSITKIPTIAQVSSIIPDKTTESVNITSNEYFDCANYLDVNVHTDADEPPNNNGGHNRQQHSKPITNPKTKDINKTKAPPQKNKYLANVFDDENDNENENENEENSDDVRFNTEVFDYDIDDDEDGVEILDDDNDELMEGLEGMENDDSLAFLRSNSLDDDYNGGSGGGGGGGIGDATGSNAGVRKYRSHVRGKAYCNLCDKTFQYYSLYRNHMIKHSNVTPYKCQYCSKAFKSKQAIRYHMNTHTKEVQYKCQLCPITYGTENQFITHVLNHESDTCFPCMVCAKLLKSDQERDEHLETHTEERPFGCEYCNKRFRQKHHLSNHLKLHCQYRCDFCKEEFASTQTQRRPYACPNCEAYPDIRQQVEKQRSKALNNTDNNPLELRYDNVGQDEDPECVDLAEMISDEESETSMLVGPNGQQRVPCKHCTRTYKHNSALNYHMRMKHQREWKKVMMK